MRKITEALTPLLRATFEEPPKSLACFLLPRALARREALGLLVPLDFDITAFTSAAYLRGSLPRPSVEISSWSRLRA